MKKFIITIIILFSSVIAHGQKYQGDFGARFTFNGFATSMSHGVMFSKDYIGLAAEMGVAYTSDFDNVRGWTAFLC